MGVGSVKSITKGSADLMVRSRINIQAAFKVNVFIMTKLTSYIPMCHKKITDWPHIFSLPLADPHFESDAEIDLILGVDTFPFIIEEGVVKGPVDAPVAQKTSFGYILTCNSMANLMQYSSFATSQYVSI